MKITDSNDWNSGFQTALKNFVQKIPEQGNKVAVIGTSLTQHNNSASAAYKLNTWSKGWLAWAQTLNPGMFVSPVWYDDTIRPGWEPNGPGSNSTVYFRGLNAGIGGAQLADIWARRKYLVENLDCNVVIIDAGTNDVPTSTKEYIVEQRHALADYYLQKGKIVILLPILSRDITSWSSASGYRQKANWVNNQTRTFCTKRNNCYFFDWNEFWVDYNTTTGIPKTGYSPDGTHFSTLSAYVVGKKLGEFLRKILPFSSKNMLSPDDLYDATLNPFGNKMANAFMTGTAGVKDANTTGSVADSMRVLRNSGAGTCVASKESRADGRGNYQVLTFTPSGSAGTDLWYFQTSTSNIAHGLSVGTWVKASIEVDVGAWAQWRGISMVLRDNATNGIQSYGMEDYAEDSWPSETWTGMIETPAFQIIDASSTLAWRVQIKYNNGITGSTGVVKLGAAELRVVEDPKTTVNYKE